MIFLIIYLFLEVMITVDIASLIGGWWTFVEIIVSAGVGFFIISTFKYTLADGMSMLVNGHISIDEFKKMSLFTLLGAVLLIIPGFFSDILGILLQFNSVGMFFARKILRLKDKNRKRSDDEAIDAEIIDVDVIE
ncbi:MAG: FxsA family protein [Sulfurospirillum sp.]|nr:MAG: FxsA family protein [Sulfurospirillum sp.]